MSRCVIVSAGPFHDAASLAGYLLPDDHIIAADGGWRLASEMGVAPSILVADFDSLPGNSVSEAVKVVALPAEKDVTDTAEALKIGYEAGYREFLLLGCTGGRLDHMQAALTTAADYAKKGCAVTLVDERNEIHLLAPGSYVFPSNPGEKISLFAFGAEVTGLFADGVFYDVDNLTLSPFDPLCVSNEAVDEVICVSFKTGVLMLYFSKD